MSALDLPDLQGNIHRPYGRFGFPHTRHLFFHLDDEEAGRAFVDAVRPQVTTAEPWPGEKPPITLNIGFTWWGLHALGLPTPTLRMMPDEFIQGMACRREILGDVGTSDPARWDTIWQASAEAGTRVHVWISLNAPAMPDGTPLRNCSSGPIGYWSWREPRAARCAYCPVMGRVKESPGRTSAALTQSYPGKGMLPTAKEHFGFTDGIGDPVFAGQDDRTTTRGRRSARQDHARPLRPDPSWQPLATGEFMLGHPERGAGAAGRRGARASSCATAPSWRCASCTRTSGPLRRHGAAGDGYGRSRRHRRRCRGARDADGEDGRPLAERHAADRRADLGGAPGPLAPNCQVLRSRARS